MVIVNRFWRSWHTPDTKDRFIQLIGGLYPQTLELVLGNKGGGLVQTGPEVKWMVYNAYKLAFGQEDSRHVMLSDQ